MKLPSYFYGIFALTLCAYSLISASYVLPSLPLPIGGVSKRMRLDGVLAAIGCFAVGHPPRSMRRCGVIRRCARKRARRRKPDDPSTF